MRKSRNIVPGSDSVRLEPPRTRTYGVTDEDEETDPKVDIEGISKLFVKEIECYQIYVRNNLNGSVKLTKRYFDEDGRINLMVNEHREAMELCMPQLLGLLKLIFNQMENEG